ncbi:MAG: putative membrane protein [Candidatus Amesbacteria bacterium GW2011_GWC1_48_10]|uniref:Putative membrane protein n=1 Tax=Candidatus Amesbacteria bacterium GW2011_GWC1_48_10 TaxID=1618365 RepID=A0A0G1UHB2_9BACT|nr:MAG: putative membrane protein [Candidatus Amesbacteria bacterium GW2011_GWC1_48_10]
MTARIKIILLLLLILILTAVSRLYGLDWDQGSGRFYVYGTFPVVFVKWLAVSLNLDSYTGIMHLGRRVSALLDIGLVLLIFLITRRIFSAGRPALLGAFFYVASVLPIQLAHFYAVDTFMVFFLVLGFYFLIHLYFSRSLFLKSLLSIFLGLSFGLAVASKIRPPLCPRHCPRVSGLRSSYQTFTPPITITICCYYLRLFFPSPGPTLSLCRLAPGHPAAEPQSNFQLA